MNNHTKKEDWKKLNTVVLLAINQVLYFPQEETLYTMFRNRWRLFPISEKDLKLDNQKQLAEDLAGVNVVFISSIPVLTALVAVKKSVARSQGREEGGCWVMHKEPPLREGPPSEIVGMDLTNFFYDKTWQLVRVDKIRE